MVQAYILILALLFVSIPSLVCNSMGLSHEFDLLLRRSECSHFHTSRLEENLTRSHRFGMWFVVARLPQVDDFRNTGLDNDLGALITRKAGGIESSALDITGAENRVNFSVTDKLHGIHESEGRWKGQKGCLSRTYGVAGMQEGSARRRWCPRQHVIGTIHRKAIISNPNDSVPAVHDAASGRVRRIF
jgi:hypothetical protein